MKYLKTYENIQYDKTLTELSNHLLEFLIKITDLKIIFNTNTNINYTFWYNSEPYSRKAIFSLYKIDYYHGDKDMFFEFKFDSSILKNDQINYVPNDLFNVIMFIYNVMKKYESQKMIKFSDIENIINNINDTNYQIYIDQNKFNL